VKRVVVLLALMWVPALVFPQHEGGGQGGPSGGSMTGWKWANFALLAGGLGYLIGKKAPAFFQGRTAQIRKGIADAAKFKADADARAAGIEKKMAELGAEIEALRAGARKESEAESERLLEETARQFAKIQAQAEREIASAAKAARMELKTEAAELAIGLAEKQLRGRITAEAGRGLVAGFVKDLENQAGAGRGVN
jgi:F-type H+-transporting ATPase subunit b